MNENLEILMPIHNEAKAISKIIPHIHQNIGDKIESHSVNKFIMFFSSL